jgi:hypothetical protein
MLQFALRPCKAKGKFILMSLTERDIFKTDSNIPRQKGFGTFWQIQ